MATKPEVITLTKTTLKTLLQDVWNPDTDPGLIDSIAQDVAAQHVLALNASTPVSKARHEDAIKHIYARVGNMAAQRYIAAAKTGETAVTGAIQAAISLLIKSALT